MPRDPTGHTSSPITEQHKETIIDPIRKHIQFVRNVVKTYRTYSQNPDGFAQDCLQLFEWQLLWNSFWNRYDLFLAKRTHRNTQQQKFNIVEFVDIKRKERRIYKKRKKKKRKKKRRKRGKMFAETSWINKEWIVARSEPQYHTFKSSRSFSQLPTNVPYWQE